MPELRCRLADYTHRDDRAAILSLMDCYARDPLGGGEPLPAAVSERLCDALAEQGNALTVLALQDGDAVGLINALVGFSTFKAQPLLNVHDVIVRPSWRGQGIAARMLAAVEAEARQRGCCKLTLEVLEGNRAARSCYQQFGFADYQLRPEYGAARFMEKPL